MGWTGGPGPLPLPMQVRALRLRADALQMPGRSVLWSGLPGLGRRSQATGPCSQAYLASAALRR
jgi:hypothetical protein